MGNLRKLMFNKMKFVGIANSLLILYGEHPCRFEDGVFGHLLVGSEANALDNGLLTSDFDGRVGIDRLLLLVPIEFRRLEYLVLLIHSIHIAH